MLEHSAMYLNVTPPYEDDSSFFPDFYTRVGSCELQEPVWAKMNALTGIKQKRKKSDNKPQTQINKCNNEKRRREQENIYIEELAELISANFADMSSLSVKPDKCAILQETVNQIRRIKQQDNSQQIADPVQQGEVSSSRPTILSNEVYGPLLLEALEGFLFVINSEGKVEHVTDNVINYIKHAKDEIIGKSIYNFMHPGDHTKFHSNLLPMTIEWGSDPPAPTRSKSIDVRLLVKASDDLDETVEEKTQRVPCYELMHISSTQLRDHLSVSEDDGSDSGPCLLCVASRISHRDKASCFFEQFTTKLDTNGKIICVDTSGVSEGVSQVLRKDFKGRLLRDLVPAQDVFKVTAHLKETLSAGTSISSVYRIQVAPDKLVPVQTKSKFFKTNPHANSEVTDFIMATHSIIGDNDSLDPGGGIGGPLMTSIVNGAGPAARNGPSNSDNAPPSSSGGIIPPVSNAGAFTSEFLENDFSTLDFPSTTWELEPSWPDAARPNSRQSTPVSTPAPRPPSNPSYSNAPTVAQSPIAHYAAQPSPVSQQQSNQNSNSFMSFGIMEDYQEQVFNVDDQKESKANVMDEAPSHAEPQRLRSLLTNPPTSNASSSNSSSHQDENRDRILKELLNQQDDEQRMGDGRNNNARVMMRGPMPEPPKNAASSSTGNDMLRKLLNDKNDEDDIETKAGMKKGSELLQQLLKKDSDDDDERKNENGPHEDVLLKTLGFPSGSPSGNKRSMDNKDDRSSKRMNNGSQNSSGSSEKSEIYQKNKMLASLLENPTPTPPSIPPIPASVISATPQEKLPRVITDPAKLIPVTMNQGNMRPGRARQQPVTFSRPIGAANPPNFIDHNIWIENNNDPVLSAILDDFIDFVPDRNILLSESGQEGQPTNSFQLSESAAINNIQKILMEVEDSVPSPNVSLPARPPAYSTNNNLGYPPPPNYHQVKYPRPMGVRAGVPQYANPQQQLHLEQQRKIQHREAEEQKRRLLQQQEQQQLVILSNNASASINPTQTFDSLLNNTVAPNVTLQRNNIPESQLSPGYNNQLQGSNSLSQSNQRGSNRQQQQQQPYSPHSQLPSPLAQQNFQPQTTAAGNYSQQQRLSPQSQYNSQLSPRQTYTTQGNGTAGGSNWAQQQQRLTVQNPMLNAQLTGTLTGRGNFQRPPSAQQSQQQRALNSPGGVQGNTRHSPFGGDQFAPPSSPTAAAFNQNQYLQRLQRANSVPTTSSQMTGGLGSPRSYSGQAPSHYPPTHLQSIPQNPMLYGAQTQQQDSPYNCYEQQQQQQPNLGYERRGGAQTQHLQPGVAGSNPTSEFVRQELRAVVGARTAQQQPAGGQRSGPTPAQQLQQQLNQSGTVDLESLGLSFEMASGASESPKLWGAMGSELGSMSPQPATSRTTMEEGRPGDHAKTSLLQQLLSDQSK